MSYRFGILLAFAGICFYAKAHPYASGVTNNNGNIEFILNEGGGDVNVVFEDNSTNAMGILDKGLHSFPLGGHTSYSIIVKKLGNGVPTLISTDTDQWAMYANGRGVAVNKNPKSPAFGRIYAGSFGTGGYGYGTPGYKPQGVFYFNADYSSGARGTNAAGPTGGSFGSSGPWRMRVSPDDTLLVGDWSGNGSLYQFAPDLSSSTPVFLSSQPSGIHGDGWGTAIMTGSLETGDLTLYVADGGMAVPSTVPVLGPNTHVGDYNCIYRYDIGAGPIPASGWANPPDYAYTVGLSSIAELRPEIDIGKDGKIIAGFGRANLSNPDIQILSPDGLTPLWDSWADTGGSSDPWNGVNGSGAASGMYCGVRVSPDGRFLASVDQQNGITIALMTNGIPDNSTIFGIKNAPNLANSRGVDWDAADNIYVISSGQLLLRTYSLGITTTCITSNDFTGTNGSFQLILPSVSASVVATTPLASQNYINNTSNPGTPIPGVFTVSLTTNHLEGPVVVNFALGGNAVYGQNYTINTDNTLNGVVITENTITFPAGNFPGGGNWSQDVQIIPTATPVIGPTLNATLRISGGATYTAATPIVDTVSIANTGPQLLLLSASPTGTTMNRGISGDYAKFIITRWGDTNGPGNSAGNVAATSYTVTNFIYTGTAAPFPADYTAAAQNLPPSGIPVDGAPGIVIDPGSVVITGIIGNPVFHSDLNVPPTNVDIKISLANASGTNLTSLEGQPYSVSNNTVTLTEFDNTVGPEVVVWSNPLTNSADSTNWTLTFASTNLGVTTVPPVVIPNYSNSIPPFLSGGGSNNFNVIFGSALSNGVPQSPVMAAKGWDTALRMTVNKDFSFGAPAGVNVYPNQVFKGNYALRFNMYLSLYANAIDNPVATTFANEFATFGINHGGTNCNWKPSSPVTAATGGSGMTNSDGIWMAVNAGAGSASPADYDGFAPFPLPNSGITGTGVANGEPVSNTAKSQSGVFKRPPFAGADTSAQRDGGSPVNKWVDVSIELTKQTNLSLFINRSQVLASYAATNGYTEGKFMLGYLDPVGDVSDETACVYYSNVRVVELSPYITNQPVSRIAVQGDNVSFTSSATYGTAPITNQWYDGAATLLQTDTAADTSITSSLALSNVSTDDAANYYAVSRDVAGSVTGLVASLEVVVPPANVNTDQGADATFTVQAVGPAAPTSYQWMFNGTNLVNNSHYSGVTTPTLTITNVQPNDVGDYSVSVVNPAGTVAPSAALSLNIGIESPSFSSVSISGANVVLLFSSPNGGDTTNSYTLQSSPVVTGPYTNTPASFSFSEGTFQVTVPQNGSNVFYRLLHN